MKYKISKTEADRGNDQHRQDRHVEDALSQALSGTGHAGTFPVAPISALRLRARVGPDIE